MTTQREGLGIQWLREHVYYPHEAWCLIWPFATARGYGHFSYLGEMLYSHTYMCEMVHGHAPTERHQAAHSCGMGHESCVNPHHLSWKTPSENQLDKRVHGTSMKVGRQRFRLKPEDVAYIRSLKDQKTHDEIARIFNISRRNVGAIIDGRSWGPERKHHFNTDEEAEKIRDALARGLNFPEVAALVNQPVKALQAWAYRNGLRSGKPCFKKNFKKKSA